MRRGRALFLGFAVALATVVWTGQDRFGAPQASEVPVPPPPPPKPALLRDGSLIATRPALAAEDVLRGFGSKGERVHAQLEQVELLAITYLSDGLRVRGYLAYPRGGERVPCVIYNRGGNRAFGAFDDVSAALTLVPLAAEGYVVVASQYRGNGGGEGREQFGGEDVNDVLNLIPLLEDLPRADASRIGMIGWSRGAMMTYLALARTDRIAAAIVAGGESDLRAALDRRPEMRRVYRDLIPGFAKDVKGTLDARSAAQWPEKLHKGTPILVLHGSADWRVDPGQALLMARRLYDAQHPFRLVLFEGGDHGLNQFRGEVGRLQRGWLRKYVRDRARWPSLVPHGG